MPTGKHQVHSVSGRHNDDRWRNAHGVFPKAPKLFLIVDLYQVDTEIAEVHADIARSFSKSIIPLLP